MDPNDLVDLLNRNRQQMSGGVASARRVRQNPLVALLGKILSTFALFLFQTFRKHPLFMTLSLFLFCFFGCYIPYNIPRNGVKLSPHTTLLPPPTVFVQKWRMQQQEEYSKFHTSLDTDTFQIVQELLEDTNSSIEEEDEDALTTTTVWPKSKIRSLHLAITTQSTLSVDDWKESDDEEESSKILDLLWHHASKAMEQSWTSDPSVRYIPFNQGTTSSTSSSTLIVKGIGKWRRYGMVPLKRTFYQNKKGVLLEVVLSTCGVKSPFEGQLYFRIVHHSDTSPVLQVQTSLCITPRTKISSKLAQNMIESLHQSLIDGMIRRTQQSLVRKSQSQHFQQSAKERAMSRRQWRFEKEEEIEAMAVDRRRRWQRGNPDAGRYRPSGDRMKSPNNAVY